MRARLVVQAAYVVIATLLGTADLVASGPTWASFYFVAVAVFGPWLIARPRLWWGFIGTSLVVTALMRLVGTGGETVGSNGFSEIFVILLLTTVASRTASNAVEWIRVLPS